MRAKTINESHLNNQNIKRFEGIVTTKAQDDLVESVIQIGTDILDDGGELEDIQVFVNFLITKALDELNEMNPPIDFEDINMRAQMYDAEDEELPHTDGFAKFAEDSEPGDID
jgi:hypothetical protein